MSVTRAIARGVTVCFLLSPAAGLAAEGPDSITYQINVAHSGQMAISGFHGKLKPLWTQNLGSGAISYPLIASNLVYVTAANTKGSGTELFALDATTGATVWQQPITGSHHWSNAAYDAGQVFVVNFDGLVQAFGASSGALNWSAQLSGQFSSPPAPQTGFLYLSATGASSGTVYELDETNGDTVWTAPVEGGAHSSPVLGTTGVTVTYACEYYKFAVKNGDPVWHDDEGCSGSGGRTAAWYKKLLFVRDPSLPNLIVNDDNGKTLGTFPGQVIPALYTISGQEFGVSLSGQNLVCFNPNTGSTIWNFAGDGQMTTAPIAVSNYVVEGSGSGNLYVLDGKSGKKLWSGNVGAPIPAPDETSVSQPLTGLGAGDGIVIIPAGAQISAFGPG